MKGEREGGIRSRRGAAYLSIRTSSMAYTRPWVRAYLISFVGVVKTGRMVVAPINVKASCPWAGYDVREGSNEGNKHTTCRLYR